MWDSVTGKYSLWNDITTPNIQIWYASGWKILQVITTFWYADPGGSPEYYQEEFNCGLDSLFVYVWDCNDGDQAGTGGEFAAIDTVFAAAPVGMLDVYLSHFYTRTGIADKPELPREYFVNQNTPNPFNARTMVEYGLPEDAHVNITVTNLLGQKVKTLVDGHEEAGYKKIVWDGTDHNGKELPSGVYFYNIRANDFSAKKRAILMK